MKVKQETIKAVDPGTHTVRKYKETGDYKGTHTFRKYN